MTFHGISEGPCIAREFRTEKRVDVCRASRYISQCKSNMLVGKSALLEFGNADVIEHGSKKRVKVFHERGEILLEYSNNEVRSIIRRLA